MKTRGIKRLLKKVSIRVHREIADNASRGGLYAHGLAGEGYAGGYADAIQDIKLALNGVCPHRRDYWNDIKESP